MKILLILILEFICFSVIGETNLGTINTVENGFATLNECEADRSEGQDCNDSGPVSGLRDILNFTTTNQCIASREDFDSQGIAVPKCPETGGIISGLDNTYPTAGTFALYTGDNDNFLMGLVNSYLSGSRVGKFNLVVPKEAQEFLKGNSELLSILNSNRVNIIEVDTMPVVGKWMQDSFQFVSLNGKPAIYQLSHRREVGTEFEHRLACELARKCDIPYYVPPDVVNPENEMPNTLNSGGNLEVFPGGTFYTGTIQTEGYPQNLPENGELPYRTLNQEIQKRSFEASGNTVIDLDVSFLKIAHVDEIINIVKTNKPAPCDYAVMMASPRKAFELMEKEAEEREVNTNVIENRCSRHSYIDLYEAGLDEVITNEKVDEIYNDSCIDGEPIENYVETDEFQILKRENLTQTSPASITQIMENNKAIIIEELRKTTSCDSPEVIEIPVFFRDGLSYTPDIVNGVVETSGTSASNIYLPRSYFRPFDNYVTETLAEVGVSATFIHDMGYHLRNGEVHCGTNTPRICNL